MNYNIFESYFISHKSRTTNDRIKDEHRLQNIEMVNLEPIPKIELNYRDSELPGLNFIHFRKQQNLSGDRELMLHKNTPFNEQDDLSTYGFKENTLYRPFLKSASERTRPPTSGTLQQQKPMRNYVKTLKHNFQNKNVTMSQSNHDYLVSLGIITPRQKQHRKRVVNEFPPKSCC